MKTVKLTSLIKEVNKKSEDYKPVYDRGTQKLPYGSNYHEMNIAGEKKIPEQVFVPPKKELSVMPTGAISSYFREEPEKKIFKALHAVS